MKFICENCKAKYQIGDDKIAGRSVRMKCRRCGHLIQLSASVTEAGGAGEAHHEAHEVHAVETASSASISVSALLGQARPMEEPDEEGPTKAMTLEQRIAAQNAAAAMERPTPVQHVPPTAPVAPAARAAPGAAAAPHGPAAPGAAARSGAPGAAARAGAPGAAAGPSGAPRPASAFPGAGAPRPGLGASGAPGPLGAPKPAISRPAPAPGAAGVAGAFQRSLSAPAAAPAAAPARQAAPSAPAPAHVPHGEDWYVGVGGVPLGPVRLAVIREKALTGAVHPESLVWREGFDEWQPLKNFPELLEIVEEAQAARAAQRRPSAMPPPHAGAPRPVGITAPSPLGAKAPAAAPAPFQPRATAVGVGLPAVQLPGAKAPLASSTAPAPLSVPSPASRTAVSGAPAPHRPESAPAIAHPSAHPGARPSVGIEATRPSSNLVPPGANLAALDLPQPTGLAVEPASPFPPPAKPSDGDISLHKTAVSAGNVAPAPVAASAAASDDLFGLAGAAAARGSATPPPASVSAPPATSPSGALAGASLDVMKDPFAAPAGSMPAPAVPEAPAARASSVPAAPAGRASSAPETRSLAPAPMSEPPDSLIEERLIPRKRAGMHPIVYAFIAMAAAFGGVAAFLVFSRPPPQVIVQTGSGTASPTVAPTAAPGETAAPAIPSDVPTADPSSTGPRVTGGGSGSGGGPKPTASTTSAPLDTSGFGNQVVPLPVATATATGPDPTLGQLSQGEIQGVVAANQARVKKRCWQPALDSAQAGVSPNARVKGRITIGASGSVDSASASGAEKDFPGLSSCIAGQMKGWKFPPSGGSTTVDVPFVFAGQ